MTLESLSNSLASASSTLLLAKSLVDTVLTDARHASAEIVVADLVAHLVNSAVDEITGAGDAHTHRDLTDMLCLSQALTHADAPAVTTHDEPADRLGSYIATRLRR